MLRGIMHSLHVCSFQCAAKCAGNQDDTPVPHLEESAQVRTRILCAALTILPVCVAAAESDERLFRNPTFEELANATVTTVTRTLVAQFDAPAAAYVMTAQDIRSSG